MYAGGSDQINVSIFVSHLVATYDPKALLFLMFSDAVISRMIKWLRIPDSEAELKAVLI